MHNYVILSEKTWHSGLAAELQQKFPEDRWVLIDRKEDFTPERLAELDPAKIFIPHWSYLIPETIWSRFECVVFHMTDLPYGRGGSPLQNLIMQGHTTTKISALKVQQGLDTGDIYLKKDLSLDGTASGIFERASRVIAEMIREIVETDPRPQPQSGEATVFKRRTPEESNLRLAGNARQVYDMIRMLDCPGYPPAFLETASARFEFTEAVFDPTTNTIQAHVRITQK
jgi:methionyl-tRNA formyltransferase